MRFFNFNLAWAVPATIAIAAMWGVSACANWYAGASFGDGSVLLFGITSAQGFSAASLSADILKTVMLFAATAALATRNFRAAGVTGSIWLVCTMWSVISATGFVAINQGNVSDTRGKTAAEWSQLEKQIVRLEQRRDEVKAHRPQKAVQAEIDGILRIPGVDGCAAINGPVTREHCPRLTSLRQELAHAESALWLDSELERLRKEQQSATRVTSENPWAELVAGLTTASASQVMTGRALWFAFMLELISGPGLWALWVAYASTLHRHEGTQKPQEATKTSPAPSTPPKAKQPVLGQMAKREPLSEPEPVKAPHLVIDNEKPKLTSKPSMRGPVQRWKRECLEPTKVGGCATSAMHDSYVQWCRQQGYSSYALSPFGKKLSKLGLPREGKNAGAWRPGWKLKEVALAQVRAA